MSFPLGFPSVIGQHSIELDSVHSTNQYLSEWSEKEILPEGTAVSTKEQTQGRGQKGTVWQTEKGKNLIVSFLLFPDFLLVNDQFLLSKVVALSVSKTVRSFLPENTPINIKWPNDIYVNHQKIAGILIENSIHNSRIRKSIVGIGMNVNQVDFPNEFHATSLMLSGNQEQNIQQIFEKLCENLNLYYSLLKSGQLNRINESYLSELYQLNQWANYQLQDKKIVAEIKGVDQQGKLQLKTKEGDRISADLKEIIFLREPSPTAD